MADRLRFTQNPSGTKFRLVPQPGFAPELVHVTPRFGRIQAGPRDDGIEVIDAKSKVSYKDDHTLRYRTKPPFKGKRRKRVRPDRDGNFLDGVKPGSLDFLATAAFAATRFTLEVWRFHLGRDVKWHFGGPTLELIPRVRSANAWIGEGFLELGYDKYPDEGSRDRPFAASFDAVSHETGHLIMKGLLGNPPFDERSIHYRAHEEAAADLITLVSLTHFDSVVRDALERTGGLLHGDSALSLMSEWGRTRRLKADARRLFNEMRLEAVREAQDPEPDKYDLSLTFSGASFDVLLGIYYAILAERKHVSRDLAAAARHVLGREIPPKARETFARAYRARRAEFREALLDARDYFARVLAGAWRAVEPRGLTFARSLTAILAEDKRLAARLRRRPHTALLRTAFDARDIVPAG
ncbi:MAG: hypothetical protein ACREM3_22200 [Candidatus Rokuibacteriota bacterium]